VALWQEESRAAKCRAASEMLVGATGVAVKPRPGDGTILNFTWEKTGIEGAL
jgi:hypothetical protein